MVLILQFFGFSRTRYILGFRQHRELRLKDLASGGILLLRANGRARGGGPCPGGIFCLFLVFGGPFLQIGLF